MRFEPVSRVDRRSVARRRVSAALLSVVGRQPVAALLFHLIIVLGLMCNASAVMTCPALPVSVWTMGSGVDRTCWSFERSGRAAFLFNSAPGRFVASPSPVDGLASICPVTSASTRHIRVAMVARREQRSDGQLGRSIVM